VARHRRPDALDREAQLADVGSVGVQRNRVEVRLHPARAVEPVEEVDGVHRRRRPLLRVGEETAEDDLRARVGAADRRPRHRQQAGVAAGRDRPREVEEVLLVPDLPGADRHLRQRVVAAAPVLCPELAPAAIPFDRRADERRPGPALETAVDRHPPRASGGPAGRVREDREDLDPVFGRRGDGRIEAAPDVVAARGSLRPSPRERQPQRFHAPCPHPRQVLAVDPGLRDDPEEAAGNRLRARGHEQGEDGQRERERKSESSHLCRTR